MNDLRTRLCGLWLPLVTPFRDGQIDERSLRRLVRHYAAAPIDGLILAATSGEGLLLSASETERLVDLVRTALDDAGRQLPICLGLAGAAVSAVTLRGNRRHSIAGWYRETRERNQFRRGPGHRGRTGRPRPTPAAQRHDRRYPGRCSSSRHPAPAD